MLPTTTHGPAVFAAIAVCIAAAVLVSACAAKRAARTVRLGAWSHIQPGKLATEIHAMHARQRSQKGAAGSAPVVRPAAARRPAWQTLREARSKLNQRLQTVLDGSFAKYLRSATKPRRASKPAQVRSCLRETALASLEPTGTSSTALQGLFLQARQSVRGTPAFNNGRAGVLEGSAHGRASGASGRRVSEG